MILDLIITLLVNSFAIWVGAKVLEGVELDDFQSAFSAAAIFGLVNWAFGWLIAFFSLPFLILTLGLFHFVINGLLIYVADKFVEGLRIKSFGWAILLAIVMWGVNWGFHSVFG